MERRRVVVTEVLLRLRALVVRTGEGQRLLVQLDRLLDGEPLPRNLSCHEEELQGFPPNGFGGLLVVGPRQVCVLSRCGRDVVVSEQLGELIETLSGQALDPGSVLRVGSSPASLRQG